MTQHTLDLFLCMSNICLPAIAGTNVVILRQPSCDFPVCENLSTCNILMLTTWILIIRVCVSKYKRTNKDINVINISKYLFNV